MPSVSEGYLLCIICTYLINLIALLWNPTIDHGYNQPFAFHQAASRPPPSRPQCPAPRFTRSSRLIWIHLARNSSRDQPGLTHPTGRRIRRHRILYHAVHRTGRQLYDPDLHRPSLRHERRRANSGSGLQTLRRCSRWNKPRWRCNRRTCPVFGIM